MVRGLRVLAIVVASLAVGVVAGVGAGGCGDGEGGAAADAGRIDSQPLSSAPGEVPAEPQRDGDPAIGYDKLVNADYVSCGIPFSLYAMFFGGGGGETIPGRTGRNATLPYNYTAFTTPSGVEVVSTNCLVCHAGRINGELVIGLGAADGDFTDDVGSLAELAGNFLTDEAERAEWRKWADRVVAISGYTVTATIGVNPADNLAAVLFAHRDRDTLAWSFEPLMELPPEIVVPVDVPPWWRMQKKHAMFYDGAGRGDHARIMMSASALCTDTVDEARAIDAYFPDVRAYLLTLVPPVWPFPVDAALADTGRIVFDADCASCHGQYGAGREGTYPNLVVAVEDVGTDQTLALGASQFAGRYVNWFNESFYGEIARLAPAAGYYAPPLDGIWSTAPFLHNGSVPTLAALLESGTRPTYWTRNFADSTDYDPAAVGWHWTPVDHGQAAEPDAAVRKTIYDTTKLGYSNAGHTYSDAMSAADRAALLEYLKTI